MREKLIKAIVSSRVISYGSLVLLTFIVAMKHPLKDQSPLQGKSYHYLALGDSYTIGEKVDTKQNFPNQVTESLKKDGYSFAAPDIIAQTGWTTDELQQALLKAAPEGPYDFVTLLIGVNNQYRGKDLSSYIPQFESLLRQSIQYAGRDSSRVIVLSIPDWSVTPFANASLPDNKGRDQKQIAAQIDEYNAANKLISGKYRVHYIDITNSTREAKNDPSLLAADGLHPSAKEYERWAKQVAELIKSKM
jgi:lysophospholipase L1-like esterase